QEQGLGMVQKFFSPEFWMLDDTGHDELSARDGCSRPVPTSAARATNFGLTGPFGASACALADGASNEKPACAAGHWRKSAPWAKMYHS
ncbi:hypothetical protein, partial [Mesorhizobium sp. M7A.F.Ca.US.007.01.1.1]|uniref:hypothetical protein n=1 Tax=Mesorhizobium sp. M7A.F.Ca.US.007.01.1.1 TaxID=2496712 RepID=UPI0019D2F6D2